MKLSDLIEKANVTSRTITNLKQLKNVQEAIAVKISKSIGVKPGGLSERTILASALQWGFILSNPALRIKAPG